MEEVLLEFKNVTGKSKKFKLDNINFRLPAGYVMGLMGENGAGKTTLIDYIMNPKVKYTGDIYVGGINIRENHKYLMNYVGFVSEENEFFENRTAGQNVDILSRFYENFDVDLFNQTMREMEVSRGITYSKMSRGERLKFQMAFAIAHKPIVYLLDEVTAGMDPVFRIDFHKVLNKLIQDERASVLMTSHIETELEQKTDYVGILERGKLVKCGETLDIIQEYKGE